ncbi:hypothetical protein BP5796_07806 [Coleophoma crateriformis]|uniref:Uncharacterized protein n=1 Tax=Coleophoma crateriformis TaxID=565419 RepID=A0A3D8RCK3_9HELO|nr:hypothetical protein BP5796_07806 [Coleophoma crateriformis]
MASSPSKRRKLLPTTSVPIAAPTTPSRIPAPSQDIRSAGRPSFASPTKASLSRHHPQLLARPSSSGIGTGARRPESQGDALASFSGNVLVREADAEENIHTLQLSIENSNGTPSIARMRATSQPLEAGGIRSIGRSMSAKPRRMSRSPMKETREPNTGYDKLYANENIDPFRKTGLRRSPPGPTEQAVVSEGPEAAEPEIFNISNPFKKTGLRRSPVTAEHAQPILAGPDTPIERSRQEEAQEGLVTRMQETEKGSDQTIVRSEAREAVEKTSFPVEAIRETPGLHTRAAETLEKASPSVETTQEVLMGSPKEPQYMIPTAIPEVPDVAPEISKGKQPSTTESAAGDQEDVVRGLFTRPEVSNDIPRPELRRRMPPAQRHDIGEPELPLTPTQRGLADPVVTTPPSGIHNTPSRRPKRNKALAAKLKSSPLKPPAERPKQDAEGGKDENTPERAFKRRKSARFLASEDPNASKKRERDELQKELQKLQSDVDLAKQECERARSELESGKYVPSGPPNSKELLAILLRSTVSEAAPPLKHPSPTLIADLGSFLPFSSRRKPKTLNIAAPESPPPSHFPESIDDPLPYLRLFTPLEYKSQITILPSPSTNGNDSSLTLESETLEKHYITARSPTGFFTAQLNMTVDTNAFQIASIEIGKMDQNAEAELGSFMRRRVSTEENYEGYFIGNDISVLGWAMGRWVDVSILRARFWCTIDLNFGTTEARAKSLEKTAVKRKRKRAVTTDEEVAGDLAGEEVQHKWTRRKLLPYMGRTALAIVDESSGVELRFEWRLDFDWTGEIDSKISATATTLASWHEGDDRGSLLKIPETFNRMVQDRGPLDAIGAVVGLLMPSVK